MGSGFEVGIVKKNLILFGRSSKSDCSFSQMGWCKYLIIRKQMTSVQPVA